MPTHLLVVPHHDWSTNKNFRITHWATFIFHFIGSIFQELITIGTVSSPCYDVTCWCISTLITFWLCICHQTTINIVTRKTSFLIGYKNLGACCSETFWQLNNLPSSHIKLFHITGVGRTRMQLAKVVIVSALILAVCAEGMPEGKSCVLKMQLLNFLKLLFAILKLFAVIFDK